MLIRRCRHCLNEQTAFKEIVIKSPNVITVNEWVNLSQRVKTCACAKLIILVLRDQLLAILRDNIKISYKYFCVGISARPRQGINGLRIDSIADRSCSDIEDDKCWVVAAPLRRINRFDHNGPGALIK